MAMRSPGAANRSGVTVLAGDPAFAQAVSATFKASAQIDLRLTTGTIDSAGDHLEVDGATVVIIEFDAGVESEVAALERLMARIGHWPPVVAVTNTFDAEVVRRLMQMRVADFLVKPIQVAELVRTCARVARSNATEHKEAEIYTFLPAVGGAGVTTLAIESAMLLLNSGVRARPRTCLVDLDFQHGACSDYLDIEPRLDLKEIEPRPERLDQQLLEIMLAQHGSGLAVIAAPNRPAEMRTFDPDMVTRLLDLVSAHFDYVVIDMPRTWFSWTDSVLLGSNNLYIVSEMTVPSLRQARALVSAIRERLGEERKPRVIVNRFEQRMFAAGLKRADLEQTLGDALAATIPNNYQLVREAIDRGVPLDEIKAGNAISTQLKKLILPQSTKASTTPAASLLQRLNLASAK